MSQNLFITHGCATLQFQNFVIFLHGYHNINKSHATLKTSKHWCSWSTDLPTKYRRLAQTILPNRYFIFPKVLWFSITKYLKISFASKRLISKGALGFSHTNFVPLMTQRIVVSVAVYHAVMFPSILPYCREYLRVKGYTYQLWHERKTCISSKSPKICKSDITVPFLTRPS